jgi:formate/nitrite transporter FocA (FNT family)
LLSALSGGLDAGFSLLLMATMYTEAEKVLALPLTDLLTANMNAVGCIFLVIGRSKLFNEHTSRAIFPVLSGHASIAQLMRLWAIVYIANTVGIAAFAAVVAYIGPRRLGTIDPSAFEVIARPLVERESWVTLVGAARTGWMMGLLSWLVSACRDTISQTFIVWLIATSIGIVKLSDASSAQGKCCSTCLPDEESQRANSSAS